MLNKNLNQALAEEILTDDLLTDDLTKGNLPETKASAAELKFANAIKLAAESGKYTLSFGEKDELNERINRSIKQSKRKSTFSLYGSAAVLIALIGMTVFFQWDTNSEINTILARTPGITDSENTQLILNIETKVDIDSKESVIAYNPSGEKISVDEQSVLNQEVKNENKSFNTLIVPFGKRAQITLSDNSKVWLNSGSKFVYPAHFTDDKRAVYLEGEALFDVSHDANLPFHVLTRDMEVKVLGTVFDVSAYSDDKYVNTVLENGSVELIFKGQSLLKNSRQSIVPGTLASYNPETKTIEQTKVNAQNYTSWKDGYVVLEKNTLGEIIKKLSRHYNVSISIESQELADESFSGYLDLRNSAVQVLDMIGEIIAIEIHRDNDQIIVTRKLN